MQIAQENVAATPALAGFRQLGDMFFGIEPLTYPATSGSELLVSDVGPQRGNKGTPPPPVGNEPNRVGVDPHGPDASEQAWARAHFSAFLRPEGESELTPVCGAAPCLLDGWDGTP